MILRPSGPVATLTSDCARETKPRRNAKKAQTPDLRLATVQDLRICTRRVLDERLCDCCLSGWRYLSWKKQKGKRGSPHPLAPRSTSEGAAQEDEPELREKV